jgi:multiple sugar transport system substrate-binding protein
MLAEKIWGNVQMDKKSSHRMNRRDVLKVAASGIAAPIASFASPAIAQARELTIITDSNRSATRAAIAQIVAAFEKETGATVTVNNIETEAHKTAIRNYLVAGPPDVCFWFSGNRMRQFVKRGLFDDISDLVARENYKDVLGSSIDAVTVDGKQWGLPTLGLYWGMFYRKDVFASHELTPPKTYDELMTMARKAQKAGLTPFAIGTKELWPAAVWFDNLNLRINGLDKHMALMNGEMSYLDPALTPVFDRWEELIRADFFLPNQTSYSWQQAATFLVQKKAAMFPLAMFIVSTFPQEEREQLALVPFPEIVPGVGPYDEVSYDSIHIPSKAKNKALAREFLAFFYRPENHLAFLTPESALSPRSDVKPVQTSLMNLAQAAVGKIKGSAQFYDRDTDPDMAQIGLNGFQEFIAAPDRRSAILDRMETARKRIFKT